MTNFATEYIRDFWPAKEINYITDPFRDLSDYYLGKLVFTWWRFENLSLENQEEIYDVASIQFSSISETIILVFKIVQWTGTQDPNTILYTFDVIRFSIIPIDNPNSLYEADPSWIPKKIIQIWEPITISLPIKNKKKPVIMESSNILRYLVSILPIRKR